MEQIIVDFFAYLGQKLMSFLNFLDSYYAFALLSYMIAIKYKVPTLNWYKNWAEKRNLTDVRDWLAGIVLLVLFIIFNSGMIGKFEFEYLASISLTAFIILMVGSIIVAYIKKKAKEKDNDNKKG